MTFAQKYNITDDEREAVIQLVADRFRNYVYVEAEHWTRETINRMYDRHGLKKTDQFNLSFTVSQVVADILVELGNHRRHHPDSWLRRAVAWLRQRFGVSRNALGG